MKKIIAIALIALLALSAFPLSASADLSSQEIYDLVQDIYRRHQLRHDFASVIADETPEIRAAMDAGGNPPRIEFTADTAEPVSMLVCCELQMPEVQEKPAHNKAISEQFINLYSAAQSVNESVSYMHPFDSDRFINELGEYLNLRVLPAGWWELGSNGVESVYVGPVLLTDGDDEILDDTVYSFCIFLDTDRTRLWLMSDLDLVHELFTRLDSPSTSDSRNNKFFLQWMADLDGYVAQTDDSGLLIQTTDIPPRGAQYAKHQAAVAKAEAEAAAAAEAAAKAAAEEAKRAWLDSLNVIGTVTPVEGSVNIREADNSDSAQIGKLRSGEAFLCVGVTESGWYEIVLEDEMVTGFVSSKLTELSESKSLLGN